MYYTENKKTRELNVLMNVLSEFGFNSIMQFQSNLGLVVDGIFGNKTYEALYNHIFSPVELRFNDFRFEKVNKNKIVWHHSAGWDNARQMFEIWKNDKRGKVATAVGIVDSGKLCRGFDEQYWAYHLGCKQKDFQYFNIPNISFSLEMNSIGVEVCNAGNLDSDHKSWYGYKAKEVEEVNYKGYKFFEKITDQECKTLKYWTLLNSIRFEIPLYYREYDMWNLSKDALTNVPGIYTHNSFRVDKNDISPQVNVIKTAKELEKYYN